jgi:hypothetical protein
MPRQFLILCLLLLVPVLLTIFNRPWGERSDVWETAAAIREIARAPWHPQNPLLSLPGDTSPRFTPYVMFWGLVMNATGLGIFAVLALAAIANYVLFVTGLYRLTRHQFRDPLLPTVWLITMLIVWGTGYGQANAYQFLLFLTSLPFVGMFTYGVVFHALASLRRFIERKRAPDVIVYALLSFLSFLTHPVTAAFGFAAALAMLLTESDLKWAALLQVVPLLAVVAALWWPYFDYWSVLTKGSGESWFEAPLFAGQIPALGTALAGIPIAVAFAVQRRHQFVVLGLLFCGVTYGLSAAAEILIGSRFLLYGTVFLHLTIALFIVESWPRWWKDVSIRRAGSCLKLAVVLLIFLPALRFRAPDIRNLTSQTLHTLSGTIGRETTAERYGFLARYLDERCVVMAEDETGWPVPAVSGARIVSSQKGNPLIQDEILRRRQDVKRFFGGSLSPEDRQALARKYGATHLLLDESRQAGWNPNMMNELPSLGREVAVHGSLVLYTVTNL